MINNCSLAWLDILWEQKCFFIELTFHKKGQGFHYLCFNLLIYNLCFEKYKVSRSYQSQPWLSIPTLHSDLVWLLIFQLKSSQEVAWFFQGSGERDWDLARLLGIKHLDNNYSQWSLLTMQCSLITEKSYDALTATKFLFLVWGISPYWLLLTGQMTLELMTPNKNKKGFTSYLRSNNWTVATF